MTTDGTLARLLASGAYVAIIPIGNWIAGRLVPKTSTAILRERLATGLAFGISAWSAAYAVLALIGAFFPVRIGLLGWVVVAIIGWRSLRTNELVHRIRACRTRPWVSAAFALGLAAAGFLYLGFPHESLLGFRDEAIYTLTALVLERTGSLVVSAPRHFIDVAPDLFALSTDGEFSYLPGVYTTSSGLVLRFPPLLSAWIAQAHASFGDFALYRTSGAFALASLVLFYAVSRRLLAPSIAIVCGVVFALNPAQIWISRINLAESLAQLLVLAALWQAVCAFRMKSNALAIGAAIAFGFYAFVRLDGVLLSPLLVGAAAAAAIWGGQRAAPYRKSITLLAFATIGAQTIAVAAIAIATPNYVVWNQTVLWVAALATLAVAPLVLRTDWLTALATPLTIRLLTWTLLFAMVALFVYGACLRPVHEPFATMHLPPGHPWDGQRDWRERSLIDIAAYLGWPTLVLALVGAAYVVARSLHGRSDVASLLLCIVFLPSALIMLANPRVSPDHFWAIRRFVPVVIPGTIILAGFGLQSILVRIFGRVPRARVWALAAIAGVSLLAAQRSTLLARENRGITVQMRDLAELTADARLVIVRDLDPIATTLLVGYGQPVAPLRDANTAVDSNGRAFWSSCTPQSPCMLVHRDFAGLSGLSLGKTKSLILTRDYIAPTFFPLPDSIAHEAMRILITPVTGLSPDSDLRLLGGNRNWNLDDSGLYRDELGANRSWRWTDGHATLSLPALNADHLEVVLEVPDHRLAHVSIALDEVPVYDGELTPGLAYLKFPLEGSPIARRLTIRSDTFVPNETGLSRDDRPLGISVVAIRLLNSAVSRMRRDAVDDNYRASLVLLDPSDRSALAIAPDRSAVLTLQIANQSNAIWPALGDVRTGEKEIALGIAWFARGDPVPRLEQRVHLPFSLRPEERLLLAPTLDPGDLPAGDYEIHVGLVHEEVTWFAAKGGALLRLPVTIAARQ